MCQTGDNIGQDDPGQGQEVLKAGTRARKLEREKDG